MATANPPGTLAQRLLNSSATIAIGQLYKPDGAGAGTFIPLAAGDDGALAVGIALTAVTGAGQFWGVEVHGQTVNVATDGTAIAEGQKVYASALAAHGGQFSAVAFGAQLGVALAASSGGFVLIQWAPANSFPSVAASATDVASTGAATQLLSYPPVGGVYRVSIVVSAHTNTDTVTATVAFTDAVMAFATTLTPIAAAVLVHDSNTGTTSAQVVIRASNATNIVVTLSVTAQVTTKASVSIERLA